MPAIKPLVALAAAFAGFTAQAQAPTQPAEVARVTQRPTAAPPALLPYQSVMSSFRGFADEPVASWRESNDTVLRIGGWQAYGRESREALRAPMSSAPRSPLPAAPASGGAHDAHHGPRK